MTDPAATDRFMATIRAIIQQEVSVLKYLGTWEYSVVGVNGAGIVNARAVDGKAPFPDLNNLTIVSGPEGGTAAPTVGNACYVRFVNGDPTRPVIVGNQAIVKIATLDATDTVNVGPSVSNAVVLAGGNAPVARDGDAVTVYFPKLPIAITGTVILPSGPTTFTGTILLPLPAVGVITTGNPKVTA